MDWLQPAEVMLRGVEEVQLFLLSNPDEHRQLPDALMISYTLIKIANTGLYAKALECWHGRTITERRQWSDFCPLFVHEYEHILHAGSVPSMQQEGYGSAFHAMGMDDDNDEPIVKSIVHFSEKASAVEAKLVEMESRMSQMEQAPPPHAAYYAPQQYYPLPKPSQSPNRAPTCNRHQSNNRPTPTKNAKLRNRGLRQRQRRNLANLPMCTNNKHNNLTRLQKQDAGAQGTLSPIGVRIT